MLSLTNNQRVYEEESLSDVTYVRTSNLLNDKVLTGVSSNLSEGKPVVMHLIGNTGIWSLPQYSARINLAKGRSADQAVGFTGEVESMADSIDFETIYHSLGIYNCKEIFPESKVLEFISFLSRYTFVRLPIRDDAYEPWPNVYSESEGRLNLQLLSMHGESNQFLANISRDLKSHLLAVTSGNPTKSPVANVNTNDIVSSHVSQFNQNLTNINLPLIERVIINSRAETSLMQGTYTIIDLTDVKGIKIPRNGNMPHYIINQFVSAFLGNKSFSFREGVNLETSNGNNIEEGMKSLYGRNDSQIIVYQQGTMKGFLRSIQNVLTKSSDWYTLATAVDTLIDKVPAFFYSDILIQGGFFNINLNGLLAMSSSNNTAVANNLGYIFKGLKEN